MSIVSSDLPTSSLPSLRPGEVYNRQTRNSGAVAVNVLSEHLSSRPDLAGLSSLGYIR